MIRFSTSLLRKVTRIPPKLLLEKMTLPFLSTWPTFIQLLTHRQPPLPTHPREPEDNPRGFPLDNRDPFWTCPKLAESKASTGHFDSKLDDMKLKLDRMDSRLDHMESSFTAELSTIKELSIVLVAYVV